MTNKAISQLTTAGSLGGSEPIMVSKLSTTVTMTATTLSAQASDNSFNDSANGFITEGFAVGDRINVSGFTGNAANNIFSALITARTAGKITIGGTDGDVIVDDAAGESVTITKWESYRTTAQAIANLAPAQVLSWKQAVRAATTAAGTLATSFENGDTVDGVVLATGDRILIKNQATASENGIYTVNASGAPTRATDADTGAEMVNAAVFVSEGTTNADTLWVCTTNAPITPGSTGLAFAQLGGSTSYTGGVQSVPILAAAMIPATTSGAAAGTTETTTNKVMLATLDFDQSTEEYAQFMFPMPKSWNEGTVTAQFVWTASSGSGDVVWGLQGVAISNDDALDAAWGTAQEVTDTLTATGDQCTTSFTSAITIGGSPAEGDLVMFRAYRKAANGSDTLTADAKLIAIRLNFTTNASDDS